ncbi:hypothetical protein J4447_01695 [Candidatus Pacearchaeota archaeon]|nr:hypothetical protein [Candidatus Pacearchaeota archaeon]
MDRILFNSRLIREKFFIKILEDNGLKSWKEAYEKYKIPRSTFDRYRYGHWSIPSELYSNLIITFKENDLNLFSKNIKLVDANWGRIKGGKESYKKNKTAFDKGRKLGLVKILQTKPKPGFDHTKIETDCDLAYVVGLWIGDGFSNKYGGYYLTQFVGHKKHELKYYTEIICKYLENRFRLSPKIKKNFKGNFIRVNIYSKEFFNLLTKNLGLPAGRKSHTILIPQKIILADKEILLACVAGIYDAEGCIFFDKRKEYPKPYPRIDLHMLNLPILHQVKVVLEHEGIICSFANKDNKNQRILVYGEKNVKRFLEKVPIKNPKHLNKLKRANLV